MFLFRHLVGVLALTTVCIVSISADAPRAKLGIYIESLCPDSRRFFVNQLVPAYSKLAAIIDPDIVPFGHARTLGAGKMVCQHGARECDGNRLMACVLARGANELDKVNTIGCIFSAQETPKECVDRHLAGVSFDEVEKCKGSDESYRMMVEAEKRTGRLGYVPHLTYDGKSSEEIQQGLEHDLINYVCQKYDGPKPDACKNPAVASTESPQFK